MLYFWPFFIQGSIEFTFLIWLYACQILQINSFLTENVDLQPLW